jgi:hypothetical protein
MYFTPRVGITTSPHAHQTVALPGFANFFMMLGRLPAVWPFTPGEHRVMLENPDPAHYDLRSFSQV